MSATASARPALRPMDMGDLVVAAEISAASFGFDISAAPARRRWLARVGHVLASDPGGAFAAELDGQVVGVAQAMLREGLWCLSLLSVLPEAQGSGAGRELLARALAYGSPAAPGLIVSSNDPRALRLYGLSGFALRPTLEAEGSLRRERLPRPDPRVRDADASDLDALAEISRAVRGAAHTPELEFALRQGGKLLRLGDAGFAVAMPGHAVWLLTARDEDAARALLWQALELAGDSQRPLLRWITGEQEWAVDVVLEAGLGLRGYGALAVRAATGTLHPYIPSGPFA